MIGWRVRLVSFTLVMKPYDKARSEQNLASENMSTSPNGVMNMRPRCGSSIKFPAASSLDGDAIHS